MSVVPTYGANSTSFINSYSQQNTASSELNQDQFLSMLVAQMSYQDPLAPMDSQQFAAQLAQFTSVEQLVQMNASLDASLEAQLLMNQAVNNTMSAQLMGLNVEAINETVVLDDGESTPIMYELPGTATTVTVTIYDDDGSVVKTEVLGMQPAGEHTYEWDGTNDLGVSVNNGEYTFEVTAATSEGNSLQVDQFITGIITGVIYEDGSAVLKIGNLPVYLSNVTALNLPDEG